MSNSYKFLNDTLHVGQPSVLELTFNDSVTVNQLPNVLGILIVGDIKPTDSTSTVWNVNFSTFKLGILNFDSLKIPYTNSKGEEEIVYLNGEGPMIGTSILDTNFKSSYFGDADYPIAKGELAALMSIFIIIIAVISTLIYRFVTREIPIPPKPFYEDPEKSSKEKLDELMGMELWMTEEGIKDHYFILSGIIKFHFSVELQMSFMDNTTIEILSELKEKFQYEQFKKIKRFFDDTDIIKYTKMIPSEQQIQAANSEANSLITVINLDKEGEDE